MTITFILIFFPFMCVSVYSASNGKSNSNNTILVDLNDLKLYLIDKDNNNIIKSYSVASGKRSTPSPTGTWKIVGKYENWGTGFGTRFMALNVPWGRYGIHGTNKPFSIGGSDSHGCIRMYNRDVEDLYKRVNYGTIVVIYGGPYDLFYNRFRTLLPGDRGSDVFEVQRLLSNKGYYRGRVDGVYGDGMKNSILRFRKDNKLYLSHIIDGEFYKKLGAVPFE